MIRYAFLSSKISDNNDDPFFDALLSPTKQRLKMLWISAARREPFTELSPAFLTWGNMNYGDGDGDIDYSLSLRQRSSRNAFLVRPGNVSISTVIVVGTENKLKVICLTWLAGSKFSIALRGRVGVSMSMAVLLKVCFWFRFLQERGEYYIRDFKIASNTKINHCQRTFNQAFNILISLS